MRVFTTVTEMASMLGGEVTRPVTADPSRVAGAPCVLVDLPRWDGDQRMLCGQVASQMKLICIGQPGMLAELKPLSDLVDEVLDALDRLNVGVLQVQPAAYIPFNQPLQAEPSTAYEITIERYI